MTVYLNNAATGWPKAPGVAETVASVLESIPSHPGRCVSGEKGVLTRCRELLAGMLNVPDPNRIVLTMHATHSLNLAIYGMGLPEGSNAILTVTEHNSVLRPFRYLEEKDDIQITLINIDDHYDLDIGEFDRALENNPRAVAINYVSNVTGRIQDVAPLFKKAKEVGAITLLDATAATGHIPVHPEKLHADIVAFTGHKGLLGPPGTGALYVAPHIELEQIFMGGTGLGGELESHPTEMPMRLEAGTPNIPAFAGLVTALEWLDENLEEHVAREVRISTKLRKMMREIPGVKIYDDFDDVERVGIISFSLDGWAVEDTGLKLIDDHGISCRTGCHCAPLMHEPLGSGPDGTVRFSVSGFTTDDEIETAVSAVRELALTVKSSTIEN